MDMDPNDPRNPIRPANNPLAHIVNPTNSPLRGIAKKKGDGDQYDLATFRVVSQADWDQGRLKGEGYELVDLSGSSDHDGAQARRADEDRRRAEAAGQPPAPPQQP